MYVCMYVHVHTAQEITCISSHYYYAPISDSGDWISAGVVASHMVMSPLPAYPYSKVTYKGSNWDLKYQTASRPVDDKIEVTPDATHVGVGRLVNCVKGGGPVSGYSRDLYLRLPKHFQLRMFALREQYLEKEKQKSAAAAETSTSASTSTSEAEDSPDQQA